MRWPLFRFWGRNLSNFSLVFGKILKNREKQWCTKVLDKVCTTYLLTVLRRKTIHVHELIACKCYISKRCHINCQKSSCKLFMFLRSAFLCSLCQLRCISNAPFGFWESIDKPSLQQNDKVFDCDIYANILWHLQYHSEFVKNSKGTKWNFQGSITTFRYFKLFISTNSNQRSGNLRNTS